MKTLGIIALFVLSTEALAVSQDPELFTKECPEKFIGKVVDATSLGAPLSSPLLEKVRITFSVLKTERGSIQDSFTLNVLKFGPTQFEKDATYEVEMNDGFLCSALKVE